MTDTARTVVPARKATPPKIAVYNPQGLLAFSACDAEAEGAAPALVRLINETPFPRVYLDFCAHHFTENEPALLAKGFTVLEDLRATLLARPSDDDQ